MGTGRWDDEGRRDQGRSPRSRRPDDDLRQSRMSSRGGRGAPPPPEKGKLSFAKGFGIVAGMFALGVAVAFVFFLVTRPTPQIDNTPVPTNTAAPPSTPTTAPKVTPSPSGLIPGGPAYVFVTADASAVSGV